MSAAPSLNGVSPLVPLEPQRVEDRLAAGVIAPEEHNRVPVLDSITTYRSSKDFINALASGSAGPNRDEVNPAMRIVGIVVRREEVNRALAILADMAPRIHRMNHGDDQVDGVDHGVKHHEGAGGARAGCEGGVNVQGNPRLVFRPTSVLHAPEVRQWSSYEGMLTVVVVSSPSEEVA